MSKENFVNDSCYLMINKRYTATVTHLISLEDYIAGPYDPIDDNFGKIMKVSSDNNPKFAEALNLIIERERKELFYSGRPIRVDRNQALRDGEIIDYKEGKILIEYEMPNGSTALNVLHIPDADTKKLSTWRPEKNAINTFTYYAPIPYKKAFKQWGEGIRSKIICNPQQADHNAWKTGSKDGLNYFKNQ